MEAAATSGTPERKTEHEVDAERCIRLLLGMTGALNQWTDLFKSVTPLGDENWQQLRKNRSKIVNYLDAIKLAAKACCGAANEISSAAVLNDDQTRLIGILKSAGEIGGKIAKHALKPLEWSSGWASWQKVSMMSDIDDCKVSCRDGLRVAYKMTGRDSECVGRDMLFAEPLNSAREVLIKIARDLRPMSYKKIAESIRADHADLIAEAAPNEKDNEFYPSESTVRRLIETESELDGL